MLQFLINVPQDKLLAVMTVLTQLGIDIAQPTLTTVVNTSVPAAAPAAPAKPKSDRPVFNLPKGTYFVPCKASSHDIGCWSSVTVPTTEGPKTYSHALLTNAEGRAQYKRQGLMSGACFTASKTSTCPDKSKDAQAEQAKLDANPTVANITLPNTTASAPVGIDVVAAFASAEMMEEVEDTNGL